MPDDRLALLRELERSDGAIAAELDALDELYAAVEELRERALELQELHARLPDDRRAAAEAVAAADRALEEERAAAQQADEAQARAEADGNPERLAEARRFQVRARDSVHTAERRAASARERAAELDARAEQADNEVVAFEAQARELAAELRRRPRLADEAVAEPHSGPAGLAEWGTRARAALLVARNQLAAEREAVVRQANELGALVLGEALPSLSAASVARRVESDLGQ